MKALLRRLCFLIVVIAPAGPTVISAQNAAAATSSAECRRVVQKVMASNESLQTLRRQLVTRSEMSKVLVDISQTGLAAGLKFNLFAPNPEITGEYFSKVPVTIEVSGSYVGLGHFVRGVLTMPRTATIQDFEISAAPESTARPHSSRCRSSRPLQMAMSLMVYGQGRSAPDYGDDLENLSAAHCDSRELSEAERIVPEIAREMSAVLDIFAARYDTLHVLDDLTQATPDTVALTSVTRKNNVLTVQATVHSESALATFKRDLSASKWFEVPSSTDGDGKFTIISKQRAQSRSLGQFPDLTIPKIDPKNWRDPFVDASSCQDGHSR